MSFRSINGREPMKKRLGSALEGDPGHAFLFTGPDGIGKMTTATQFAKALLCQNPTKDGSCDACASCRLFEQGVHPDFRLLTDPQGKQIRVEQIRSDIIGDVNMLPQYGDRKVYLIDGDLLNEQGQNILLKTLEEPPVYAFLLITVTGPEKLVGTLRSRMVHVPVPLCTPGEIRAILIAAGVEEDQKIFPFLLRAARGVPGTALTLAGDTWYMETRQDILDRMDALPGSSRADLLTDFFGRFNTEKDHVNDLMDMIESWLRDLTLARFGADRTLFTNADRVEGFLDLNRQTRYDIGQLEEAERAVRSARRGLAANTNYEMTVCRMLLQLRKELSHA